MKKASQAYYQGTPFLSNEQYDAIFGDDGGVGSGESGDFAHLRPMYSLQKYYVGEGEPPITGTLIKTVKCDGAAVSLLYSDGKLVRALTRGDGDKGKDITDKLECLQLGTVRDKDTIQITGEVVPRKMITNARNFASGALSLKNIDEFLSRVQEGDLAFFAYGIEKSSGKYSDLFLRDLNILNDWGFETVLHAELYPSVPTDGYVYRYNDNDMYYQAGFTAHHPRGAYAEKTRDTPVETTLLDVIWQTGKTGKVTPIAILEPVVIDDAVISRATLNNYAFIEAMDLEIGCQVKVIRAGKIIPCIVGRV